jgi:SOS-response transcriptional repressor LexA
MTRPTLTDQQRRVLDYLYDYTLAHGYQPSFREVGRHFGWTSTQAVADHLRALQRKGYVRITLGSPRAVDLLDWRKRLATRAAAMVAESEQDAHGRRVRAAQA